MSKGMKPGTGASTVHGENRQNERGKGASDHPFKNTSKSIDGADNKVQRPKWKSDANSNAPNVGEAKNTKPAVHMAPKINAGTGGSPDGAKRVINTEAHPKNTMSTFKAPRSSGGSSNPIESGYTKLGKI